MPPTPQPYAGIRILDLTHDLGRYATRLFADLGAEVIRIEPPGGLADRAAARPRDPRAAPGPADCAFAFFNASKRSVVLDTTTESGRRGFARLAAGAQAVMLERGGPLADEIGWVQGLNPAAVVTIVSPWGLGGPWESAPAGDLVLQAAGGIAWMSGRPGEPPLRLPVSQSVMLTGVYAAVATALALFDAETGGRGHLIDVSAQECIAHSLQNAVQVWDYEKRVSVRGGEGTRDATEDMFACKDGLVFLSAPLVLGISWKALTGWIAERGHPAAQEFARARWQDRVWRTTAEAKAVFRTTFEGFAAGLTRDELTREALARKIVLAPVSRVRDVLADEQLAWRDYFVSLADPRLGRLRFPGAPYRLSAPVWSVAPAPALGEHTDALLGGAPAPALAAG